MRRAGRVAAALAFVGGFAVASWVVRLDRIVVSRFEGRQFRVPSRVLSAPTILYPGLDWRRIDLRQTLVRLGYRDHPAGSDMPVGSLHWGRGRVRVHLRAFDHPSRPEPARDIVMALSSDTIERIVELPGGREVGAVLLEPELVGAYYGPDREQRDLIHLSEVPPHLIHAVLSVEDQRFETHHGVDLRRILGAMLANLRAGSIRQGGSTLTQQLVKNFFLTPERTLSRKLQEAVMALLVEARYDKEAILESYLNEIYLGQRGATAIHGVGEATRLYFGKSVEDLTVGESALLAAIIQSPNRISPHRDAELAIDRRNLVLALMRRQGRISDSTYLQERDEPLRVAAITRDLGQARYFLDMLRRQLPTVYAPELLASEGVRIYSTLDLRLQRAATEALVQGLVEAELTHPELVTPGGDRLQGCLVALRPQTGEVLALVGGRDYGLSQFDRCTQARRQAGSVFKPFVYIAALEPDRGGPSITLASFLDDSPYALETPQGTWQPQNYDHEFRGRVSVREAVERSLNVPAARLGQEVGIERVVEVAARLGITSDLPEVPSLALGTAEVSPFEVAQAYATLANGGVRTTAHTFEDLVNGEGETLERRTLRFQRVLDAGTAYLATSLLEGVVERGTAVRVRAMGLTGPIAGKTGTTDDEYDLWFVGFTPELVAVVWVGFDKPRSIGVQSSHLALPIWVRFVREALGTEIRGAFLPPAEVTRVDIEPSSGALALAGCPERRPEFFLHHTEPDETCPRDVGGPGRVIGWLRDLL
ncbi:MAG: PBP1A family penicillin-binding protein [Proteobacteria bacterium]|nr:PBP1A family penicillin-binding protein [Pseudomonadota bacterium]